MAESEVIYKTVRCPHCDEGIEFRFETQIVHTKGTLRAASWRDGFSKPSEIALGEALESSGAAAAYVQTHEHVNNVLKIKDPVRAALRFVLRSICVALPKESRAVIKAHFGDCQVMAGPNDQVGMVVKDGKAVAFVPLVKESSVRGLKTPNVLEAWVRSKHGYIAGGGVFLDAMRARSVGDFARIVQ